MIQLDSDKDWLTTRLAYEIAKGRGEKVSQDAITQAAYQGNIKGAKKMWDNPKAPWVFTRESFLYWLENRRPPGRPPKDEN